MMRQLRPYFNYIIRMIYDKIVCLSVCGCKRSVVIIQSRISGYFTWSYEMIGKASDRPIFITGQLIPNTKVLYRQMLDFPLCISQTFIFLYLHMHLLHLPFVLQLPPVNLLCLLD